MPRHWGGQEWSELDVTRGYLRLGAACLTTAFIITQRTGACQRIAGSDNELAQGSACCAIWSSGETFATVGISHLTTSRRHLGRPVLRAREVDDGFVLDGFSPWVTGAVQARVDRHRRRAGRRAADSGGPADGPAGGADSAAAAAGRSFGQPHRRGALGQTSAWPRVAAGRAGRKRDESRRRRRHRRAANLDPGDRAGRRRRSIFSNANRSSAPTWPRPAAELRREHAELRSDAAGIGRRTQRVHERRVAGPSQQHRAARHARRHWPRPREPATSLDIRPGGGVARPCFFSSGAARRA